MKALFEKIPATAGNAIACFDFRAAHFDCPYHFHPECELLRIDGSTGTCIIGDTLRKYAPGDWFFFGANLPHLFQNDPPPQDRQAWSRSRCVQFLPDCLGSAFFEREETRHLTAWFERARRGLFFSPSAEPRATRLLQHIFSETGMPRLLAWLELLDFLSRREDATCLASEVYQPEPDTRSFNRLAKVIDHIQLRFRDELGHAEVARLAGMSPSAFSRYFQRHMNVSFSAYVLRLRLGHVRRELIETEDSIAEIAYRSGFNSLNHFNKQFRLHYGQTPRQFRDQTRRTARQAGTALTGHPPGERIFL